MYAMRAHDYDEIRKKDRYSPVELAELLDVELGTVYIWNYRGNAPGRIREGQYVYYPAEAIIEWIEKRKRWQY